MAIGGIFVRVKMDVKYIYTQKGECFSCTSLLINFWEENFPYLNLPEKNEPSFDLISPFLAFFSWLGYVYVKYGYFYPFAALLYIFPIRA